MKQPGPAIVPPNTKEVDVDGFIPMPRRGTARQSPWKDDNLVHSHLPNSFSALFTEEVNPDSLDIQLRATPNE